MKPGLEQHMSGENHNYFNLQLQDKHPIDISSHKLLSSSSFDFDSKNPYTLNDVLTSKLLKIIFFLNKRHLIKLETLEDINIDYYCFSQYKCSF